MHLMFSRFYVKIQFHNMAELKENILNILEEKGFISNFKSEIRAQVLKAMNEFSGPKKFLEKPEVLAYLEMPEVQLCLEIIWDFLEYAKLKNTLEIFVPECNLKRKPQRLDLENKSGITSEIGKPLLLTMIDKCKRKPGEISPDHSTEFIPSKFPEKIAPKLQDKAKPKEVVVEKKASPVAHIEPTKAPEKSLSSLAALPKLPDKNPKLQPLSSAKKVTNLRSFDILAEDAKVLKHEESPKSSIDEEIDEELEEDHKEFYESQATSSMGVDASVNSLVLDEFDHVENIRPPKRKF